MNRQYRYMEFGFDQGRLDRSRELAVMSYDEALEKLPDHHYLCVGHKDPHYLHTKPHLDCDCQDFSVGFDRLCKHLIAALRYEGDPVFMQAIEGEHKARKVRVVSGPTCSGKSTYVNKHKGQEDVVWDYDRISASMCEGDRAVGMVSFMRAMRDAFLLELKKQRDEGSLAQDVWVIWGLPKAETRRKLADNLGAEVIVLETSADQCAENEKERRGEVESVRTMRDANRWWERYDTDPRDTIVKWQE